MFLKTFDKIRSKIRLDMISDIRDKYDVSDMGVDGLLSALGDFKNYVVVLFNDHKNIIGAASYYISKKSYIEIDHIGVIERRKGYGKIIMEFIFKLAKENNKHTVSLVSNGFASDFYEKLGMVRVNKTSPAVYEMQKEQLYNY